MTRLGDSRLRLAGAGAAGTAAPRCCGVCAAVLLRNASPGRQREREQEEFNLTEPPLPEGLEEVAPSAMKGGLA